MGELSKAFFFWVLNDIVLKKAIWQPVITGDLGNFSVWLLYSKAVHWLIMINVPYFVVLSPILDILMFYFFHFVIKHFYSQATTS